MPTGTAPSTTATSTIPTALKVGRTANGYVVRVEGRGTMRHSAAAMEFARRVAAEPPAAPGTPECAALAVDLRACTYLDSTFLGAVLGMFKEFARRRHEFSVVVAPEAARALFGPTRLDKLLPLTPDGPASVGTMENLGTETEVDARALTQHVMECHRRLADVPCPQQEQFRRIADAMESELQVESESGK